MKSMILNKWIFLFSIHVSMAGCYNKLKVGGRIEPMNQAQRVAPARTAVPEVTSSGFDLTVAIQSPTSVLILAIGHAEGTINLDGTPTEAYYGHGDSGFHNIGVFSCISCGNRTPKEADRYYLEEKIKPFKSRFESAARGAMLSPNHPMLAAAFFTLLTQSPMAASDRKGFLDRMAGLKTQGISLETLVQLSVDSYRDPDTNTFKDVSRFNNDETLIRADQKRRLIAVETFLGKQGIELYPKL